jgi:hypothetical protein
MGFYISLIEISGSANSNVNSLAEFDYILYIQVFLKIIQLLVTGPARTGMEGQGSFRIRSSTYAINKKTPPMFPN